MNLELIKDEWRNIPLNIRYLILAGLACIGLSWLVDNWGEFGPPKFFGYLNINTFLFTIGTLSFFAGIILIIIKQVLIYPKNWFYIRKLRKKYPIEKKNDTFYLVSFNGHYVIFDKEEKEYHRIYHQGTANDLRLTHEAYKIKTDFTEWEKNKIDIPLPNDIIVQASKYKQGKPFNTQL